MALLVKKVVVTEVPVDTVLFTIDSNTASLHGADSKITGWATRPEWMPDVLDIDIETGLIRNWEAPTADELQSMVDHAPPIHYATKRTTEKDLSAAIESNDKNPATTTPEIQQTVEVAETSPDDQQAKTPEIEGIKPVGNHQIDALPSDAFDQGVALAESVLVPVEPEPVEPEPVEEDESLRRRTPAQPRYRNPENPEQTWTGRGKQPAWLHAAIAAGADLDDFLIGVNPSPVAAQGSDHPENTEGLPVVIVEHPSKDKWVATYLGETATSTQGLYEAIKGVLKRRNMSGTYEIKKLKTIGEAEVFTIDDSRTANAETVYLSKGVDGWIAKTPKNKSVTAAISITGELTALLEPIDNIDDHANAVIVETTDDEIRSRGKRRYSITAAPAQAVDVAAPAHAPSVPAPEEQPPATYAEIVQLINFASEIAHLDNIQSMRITKHQNLEERHALNMKMMDKRASVMAANAMRIK